MRLLFASHQLGRRSSNRSRDIGKRLVLIVPARDRHGASGNRLQFAERCASPFDRAKEDRNHASLICFVALHRPLHLHVIAIVGAQEIRTDQEQDDVGGVEMLIDLTSPFGSGADLLIVPPGDHVLPFEYRKVPLECDAEREVFARIGVEEFEWSPRDGCHFGG